MNAGHFYMAAIPECGDFVVTNNELELVKGDGGYYAGAEIYADISDTGGLEGSEIKDVVVALIYYTGKTTAPDIEGSILRSDAPVAYNAISTLKTKISTLRAKTRRPS